MHNTIMYLQYRTITIVQYYIHIIKLSHNIEILVYVEVLDRPILRFLGNSNVQ